MAKTKQKKSSAAKNVAVFLIVFAVLLGLIAFGLSQLFKTEDTVVKIGGYSVYLMDTENMGDHAPKDALIVAQNGIPSPDKIRNALVCKNVGKEGTTVAWLMDISSKGDTVDGVVYTVYQEKYPEKHYDLNSEDIVGIAKSRYPTAGKIISFVKTPFGIAACVGVPVILLIIIELIIVSKNRSDDELDDEYDDEYEDEENENQTLDDFLYGGEEDDVYTTQRPKDTYEEEFAAEEPESEPMPEQEQEEVYEEPEYEEAPAEEAEEEKAPDIDPSYYEKASKAIEEAVELREATEEMERVREEAPEPAARPASAPVSQPEPEKAPERPVSRQPAQQRSQNRPPRRRRPAARPTAQRPRPTGTVKDPNETIAELMKLMEDEQKKIRENSDKN